MSAEELADPRLVSSRDLEGRLATIIADVLIDARDRTLERLETEYGDAPVAGVSNFDSLARNALNVAISEGRVQGQSRPMMEDSIDRTVDRLSSQVHSPQIDTFFGARDRKSSRFFARSIEFDTRNAADDMLDRMRTGVRNAAVRGESMDLISSRVTDEFSRNAIRNRAKLIALMNLQNAINSTKLREYERHDDIDGIQIINPCNDATTPLCEHLAGCGVGDNIVARFDVEEGLSSQLQRSVSGDLLFEGFDPIPIVPPFHFGCRSEIAPYVITNT